jgi:hypothetical protein
VNMKLQLIDNTQIQLNLYSNPLADYIQQQFKHLQHVDLELGPRDNAYNPVHNNPAAVKQRLQTAAAELNIELQDRLDDQEYLNYLHQLYEKNFNGQRSWLDFHDMIHTAEQHNGHLYPQIFTVDYRTKAGALTKSFNREHLKYATTKLHQGHVYIIWQELGKTTYNYYVDHEPEDINRICELAKPWLHLRPSFFIACEDFDFVAQADFAGYQRWFDAYRTAWCQHWGITDWSDQEALMVIPIGEVDDIDVLIENLKQANTVRRVRI